jgi:hypothetical protein
MRFVATLLVAFCAMAGCAIVTVDGPLSDPKQAQIDEQLFGHWVAADRKKGHDGYEWHLFIGMSSDDDLPETTMEVRSVCFRIDAQKFDTCPGAADVDPELIASAISHPMVMWITRIDGLKLANLLLVPLLNDDAEPGYFLPDGRYGEDGLGTVIRYETDGRQLKLHFIKYAGRVEQLKSSGELQLSDDDNTTSAAGLAALLRKPDGKSLFTGSTAVFRKVR